MEFKPSGTNEPDTTAWLTPGGLYSIVAKHDTGIRLERKEAGDSAWTMIMPLKVELEDKGMTGFVVRGIMDALVPVPNDSESEEAYLAARAYLDELCPAVEEGDDKGRLYGRWKDGAGRLGEMLSQGLDQRTYRVYREDVRRYISNHANSSGPKDER